MFNTSPTIFGALDWTISCDPSKADKWTVGNANASEGGNHTVIQSTAQSINVGFARKYLFAWKLKILMISTYYNVLLPYFPQKYTH